MNRFTVTKNRMTAVAALAALVLTPPPVRATDATAAPLPPAAGILQRMQDAVAPAATQLAKFRMATEAPDGTAVIYNVFSARRSAGRALETTILFRQGHGYEDTVLAWGPDENGELVEALYLPNENRVRKIAPVIANTPFLRTEFTRADLGLVPYGDADHVVSGTERVAFEDAYRLEATLKDPRYYSRIVTWVSTTTYLPLRREFYDRAGRLWKIARYRTLVVDGHPTITAITLDDVQSRGRSELVMERVHYASEPLDTLFRTTALAKVPDHEAWAALQIVPAAGTGDRAARRDSEAGAQGS